MLDLYHCEFPHQPIHNSIRFERSSVTAIAPQYMYSPMVENITVYNKRKIMKKWVDYDLDNCEDLPRNG